MNDDARRTLRRRTLQLEAMEGRVALSTLFASPTGQLNGQAAFVSIQPALK